jgi:hypothetical protein
MTARFKCSYRGITIFKQMYDKSHIVILEEIRIQIKMMNEVDGIGD